jgi:hypothetical protein
MHFWTVISICGLRILSLPTWAGPPYLTDDPEPVPLHHWEAYTFYTRDRTRSTDAVNGPAVEVNNGIAPNTQIHLIIPETYFSQSGVSARGLGDIEAGVKYRFLQETKSRPEIGMFPQLELPTGDQSKGLGNGRTWVKVPLWLQKSYRAWATYGGGGYAYNPAPGPLVWLRRAADPAHPQPAPDFGQRSLLSRGAGGQPASGNGRRGRRGLVRHCRGRGAGVITLELWRLV